MKKSTSRYLMAAAYVGAGVNHFLQPNFYVKAIPPYFPRRPLLNQLSGAAEVAAGAGLFYRPTAPYAAAGVIGLLVAFLPVHTHMLRANQFGLPRWVLWARLPAQGLLIWWAARHLKK